MSLTTVQHGIEHVSCKLGDIKERKLLISKSRIVTTKYMLREVEVEFIALGDFCKSIPQSLDLYKTFCAACSGTCICFAPL